MTRPVAFVDIETTGLHPTIHEIWEIGLILPDGAEHQWMLDVDLSRADPIALGIGGFHERHPHGYTQQETKSLLWERRQFVDIFVRLTHGLHLAGAVVSFDAERLGNLIRSVGQIPTWHYHLVDVEALAAGFIAGSRAAVDAARAMTGEPFWAGTKTWRATEGPDAGPPWKSDELSLAVGVDPADFDRHTALGDCRWAKAIYEAVMGS